MTTTSVKNTMLPPGLVNNLNEVLMSRRGTKRSEDGEDSSNKENSAESAEPSTSASTNEDNSKPVILVTNGDGIESSGLVYLVEALVREGLYNVHVCAPQSDKSVSGHSVTFQETVAVTSSEIGGITAFEVSGTPVDCVSLALSGALFSWSKPLLVISGINRGSSCGHHSFYSGVVAGAREALISGVPSLSISLNWKKEESQESDFKDAVGVCLPLINAAIKDIEKGVFPKDCYLNIEIPTSPSSNKVNVPNIRDLAYHHNWLLWHRLDSKGFKLTKQSMWRSCLNWRAVSANRHPSTGYMSNQQSLGIQLAQLSRDASAAGAARRITTHKKNVEIESIGVAGKSDTNHMKKYFRLEFMDKEEADTDEDVDFRALSNGFIAITPLSLSCHSASHVQAAVSDWMSSALHGDL